jgi:hypothetical protein
MTLKELQRFGKFVGRHARRNLLNYRDNWIGITEYEATQALLRDIIDLANSMYEVHQLRNQHFVVKGNIND